MAAQNHNHWMEEISSKQDLEFEISYNDKTITWDEHSVPLHSQDTTAEEAYYIQEPKN